MSVTAPCELTGNEMCHSIFGKHHTSKHGTRHKKERATDWMVPRWSGLFAPARKKSLFSFGRYTLICTSQKKIATKRMKWSLAAPMLQPSSCIAEAQRLMI